MLAPLTDLFYQDPESEDWHLFRKIYDLHSFSDSDKLVRAYLSFYDYIGLATATV